MRDPVAEPNPGHGVHLGEGAGHDQVRMALDERDEGLVAGIVREFEVGLVDEEEVLLALVPDPVHDRPGRGERAGGVVRVAEVDHARRRRLGGLFAHAVDVVGVVARERNRDVIVGERLRVPGDVLVRRFGVYEASAGRRPRRRGDAQDLGRAGAEEELARLDAEAHDERFAHEFAGRAGIAVRLVESVDDRLPRRWSDAERVLIRTQPDGAVVVTSRSAGVEDGVEAARRRRAREGCGKGCGGDAGHAGAGESGSEKRPSLHVASLMCRGRHRRGEAARVHPAHATTTCPTMTPGTWPLSRNSSSMAIRNAGRFAAIGVSRVRGAAVGPGAGRSGWRRAAVRRTGGGRHASCGP